MFWAPTKLVTLSLHIFTQRPLRSMKRRSAATKTILDRFSTTYKWTALAEKHPKGDTQAFVPAIRRSPLPIISGPAKSMPVTPNGSGTLTLCNGSCPISGCVNCGFSLAHLTHFDMTDRAVIRLFFWPVYTSDIRQ